jgi:hypothetical protein
MRPKSALLVVGAVVLLSAACAKRTTVQVPPRVDLYAFDLIGVVQFTTESKGSLASLATQRFVEALQESQPGVRVLELGTVQDIQQKVGRSDLGFETMRAIGEHYNVGAVVVGVLDVQDVKPRIDLQTMITSGSMSADVKASLTTRIMESATGATVWTRSTRTTSTVAQVGVNGGAVRFDAKDPERAYGDMIDALVADLTQDFRVSYVRQ